MPTIILDKLPYLPDPQLAPGLPPPSHQVTIHGQTVAIKRYQIIVWVSVAYHGQRSLSPAAARFPAILDVGTTHDFIVKEEQLRDWAQVDPARYRPVGRLALDVGAGIGAQLDVLPYNIWLHRNQPFQRDNLLPHPFCLHIGGIAYYPRGGLTISQGGINRHFDGPRLPLLGLRAFRLARLKLLIETDQNLVTLTGP